MRAKISLKLIKKENSIKVITLQLHTAQVNFAKKIFCQIA